MRKFLASTAGATFHEETPNLTFNVKKDTIEIINKLRPGVYLVINMLHAADDEVMFFAYWGSYFTRLQNPQVQIPKIEKCCPTLYTVMVGDDKDKVFECDIVSSDGSKHHGFKINAEVPKGTALIHCLTDDVADTAFVLFNKCLKIYNDLAKNPPFPAWKDGLSEVWN